ncbi:hypothetical protein [Paenibacillus hunanensis]|uniref:Uncharacterized protein n=1 Tax=Paenibacillus hunanensis TaxID=539262 RepID=A0ABU1IVC2_9BACL|nr:hypothetical protein [Paenibacillus hunanensis]MDR6243190.1 hypothetical protein [Paenibacillus hunanensis]GGJ11126.1 hypothetical protein GCM10008022_20360 [Paenibacillus hunanensis]
MRSKEQVVKDMNKQGVTPETIQKEIAALEAEIYSFFIKGGLQREDRTQARTL